MFSTLVSSPATIENLNSRLARAVWWSQYKGARFWLHSNLYRGRTHGEFYNQDNIFCCCFAFVCSYVYLPRALFTLCFSEISLLFFYSLGCDDKIYSIYMTICISYLFIFQKSLWTIEFVTKTLDQSSNHLAMYLK